MDKFLHGLIGKWCFVYIDDSIIYSRNAGHVYHLWLIMGRLREDGMKIKPNDGKQKSMTYSSESEDSEHSLAGGVIQYTYFYFQYACLLVSHLYCNL